MVKIKLRSKQFFIQLSIIHGQHLVMVHLTRVDFMNIRNQCYSTNLH
jgi:hypothetical protein